MELNKSAQPDETAILSEKLENRLFPSDTGNLPIETRRVLVQLLNGPFLDGRKHSILWPILLRDEAAVRSFLSEIFLELILDRDVQVAFTRQADTGDMDTPLLLRRQNLTYLESVMLLFLRRRLVEADARGERAVVSWEEIRESLQVYERTQNTDRAGYERRISAALEKVKKANILQKIRSSEDRYEVSPTLKLLFSPEEILELTRLYETLASGEIRNSTSYETEEELSE